MLISKETYKTCDFPWGIPYPPSGSMHVFAISLHGRHGRDYDCPLTGVITWGWDGGDEEHQLVHLILYCPHNLNNRNFSLFAFAVREILSNCRKCSKNSNTICLPKQHRQTMQGLPCLLF